MAEHCDAVVIGGGFAGIYHLYVLRNLGFKVHLFDAASDFDGIWRFNCVSDLFATAINIRQTAVLTTSSFLHLTIFLYV